MESMDLRKAGLKVTHPRMRILALLERNTPRQHMTAEDIYRTEVESVEGQHLLDKSFPSGSTAPTDNYDITIEDSDGVDVLGGAGANRDAANTERVMPLYGTTPHPCPINGALTVKIAGNIVNAATGKIKLYFVRMAAGY